MERILITGGAGYKGVLLAQKLLAEGYEVTILDNFMYGYNPVIHLLSYPKLTVIKRDVRVEDYDHLKNYDVIYHLAGISGYPACEANPNSAKLINVDATRNIVQKLSKEQVLIYASTTSFYGKSGAVCDENTEVAPVSMYGITKYQGEQICMQHPNAIALRFATVFGISPKMRPDLLVNDFAYKAVTERSLVLFESVTKRTFIHITDTINAYVHALKKHEIMTGNVFNVGSNDLNFTKMEIAKAVQAQTPCTIIDSEMKDFDTRNFIINYDKITATGFKVNHTLEEGIADLIRLYSFFRVYSPYNII